jgi:cupin fold WbuC family metalloprotein
MSDTVQLLNTDLIQQILSAAQQSPRGRMNHNFHPGAASNPHRFLNVMCRGTYVTPHRHLLPPKSESFVILHGEVLFLLFDDDGRVTESHVLRGVDTGVGPFGIDIAAGLWHSLAVLTDHAVCYEVKAGPWDPATDKEFAPWAPSEGDAACSEYLARLLARHRATADPSAGPG